MKNSISINIKKLDEHNINDILNAEQSQNVTILKRNIILSNINLDNTLYLGAFLKEKLIGYIFFSYVLDECNLESIVTLKNYTNMSIATTLINSMINFCIEKNIKKIFLEVRISNYKAINLYKKFDFKQIDIRKNYYENHEDALIFEKLL